KNILSSRLKSRPAPPRSRAKVASTPRLAWEAVASFLRSHRTPSFYSASTRATLPRARTKAQRQGGGMRIFLSAWFLVLVASYVSADQVLLANGDRLTGTIIKSDDKELTLKTDYAGEVKIQWSAVSGLTSPEALHVRTKAGQTLVGPVTSSDG